MLRVIAITAFLFTVHKAIAQKDNKADRYLPLSGKIMGASSTMYLHFGKDGIKGFLMLAKDARPFNIRQTYGQSTANDSILLTASRSPGITISIKLKWQADSLIGFSEMFSDPSQTGDMRSIRKGKTSFGKENTKTNFEYASLKKEEILPMKVENKPTFNYASSVCWLNKPTELWGQQAQKKTLEWMGQKTVPANAVSLLNVHQGSILGPWKKEMSAVPVNEMKSWGPSMLTREQTEDVMVVYEDKLLLVLSHSAYSYTGGAHGNYHYEVATFDKRNGKELKLTDVLTPQGIAQLPGMLEDAFRQQFGMTASKSIEQYGALVKSVKPSDQFYMTDAGIGFLYNPYELMPFVYGEIFVFLPLGGFLCRLCLRRCCLCLDFFHPHRSVPPFLFFRIPDTNKINFTYSWYFRKIFFKKMINIFY